MLKEQIDTHYQEISGFIPNDLDALENFRIKFLSKKGIIPALFENFKLVGPDEKKRLGKDLNALKMLAEAKWSEYKALLAEQGESLTESVDLTLPGLPFPSGTRHPISLMRELIIDIFARIGFQVAEGPEIEDDWHNFSALNFPPEHPARDMQDTFFIKKGQDGESGDIALRTHTSSVQIRLMESGKPPFKAIMPGRVYRNEAISVRSNCFFHQVEGLYVDHGVSFADLKQTLYYFVQQMFGEGTGIRFRPSYFPFTEPSAEMDITCFNCGGVGCNICKYTGWVEILGCGMIDPQVLINCHIDPEAYSGFAFGMGIDRMAMNKFKIKDIRTFFENDVRFLNQFPGDFL